MRISVRLGIYSVVLTAVAVITCCMVLLVTAADSQISNSAQSGVTELRMLDNAFNAEMEVVGDSSLSETAQHSLVRFVFRKYADTSVSGSQYVLADAAQTLFNGSPIDPKPLLPDLKADSELAEKSGVREDDTAFWPYVIAELNGRRFLVAGHWGDSLGNSMTFGHAIYLVRDITDVYSGITAMGVRFALIALTTVILSGAVMIFLIRRVLRPLSGLQKNAAALAGGQYNSRIQVKGKGEIAELGTSFNRMADAISTHIKALEDTAEQRKLLLSALTHELKTPMTAVIGYSEALMRVRLNKTQQKESIHYIHSECRRIERLSQKMMRLITLQDGEPFDIKPQDVGALYDTVRMTLQGIANSEGIELMLTEQGPVVLDMDIDMIASVLLNLFDNARKAGARHITMTAKGRTILVIDDGAGIPADEIGKVTQPFYMVDKSHSRSVGGSGLGLALCEYIIKVHLGEIRIESRLGEGTTVTIALQNKLQVDNRLKTT